MFDIRKTKILIKKLWGVFFFYGGLFHVARFINNVVGKRVTIVTYHRVTDKNITEIDASLPYLFTSADTFKKHLRFYKKWYRVITFSDLIKSTGNQKLPWNSLIITFDDGYEDNYSKAYPLLRERNLSATFFIAVDKIQKKNGKSYWWDRLYCYLAQARNWDDAERLLQELNSEIFALYKEFRKDPSTLFSRLNEWDSTKIDELLDVIQDRLQINDTILEQENSIMNWEQVNSMSKDVLCGSHSCSHSNLLQIDLAQKIYELKESKKIIEMNTKQKVEVFSYPCGKFENSLKDVVKDAGYELAVTTESGLNDLRDRYALKRINIWEDTGLALRGKFSKNYFAFKLSGF
jgi:peptidoglycan/xylan/chitin deacetylase (PgdA/CDA1 family)